jgi:hypothetical protein
MIEELRFKHVRSRWDPERRILEVEMRDSRLVSDAERDAIAAALRRWVGETGPYGVLGDAQGVGHLDFKWRLFWGKFYKPDAHRVRIAVYHVGAVERTTIALAAWAYGIDMRAFPTREDAEAWLLAPRAAGAPPS